MGGRAVTAAADTRGTGPACCHRRGKVRRTRSGHLRPRDPARRGECAAGCLPAIVFRGARRRSGGGAEDSTRSRVLSARLAAPSPGHVTAARARHAVDASGAARRESRTGAMASPGRWDGRGPDGPAAGEPGRHLPGDESSVPGTGCRGQLLPQDTAGGPGGPGLPRRAVPAGAGGCEGTGSRGCRAARSWALPAKAPPVRARAPAELTGS